MKTLSEIVKLLNELKIIQKKMDWAESLPDNVWKEHFFEQYEEVKHNLDVDTHRWYETSVTVIKINDGLMGIRHITNMFSEQSDPEDIYFTMEFFEMEPVTVISYQEKK